MSSTASLLPIRAISFDLDDTFWDCAPAINNAENVLYDWLAKRFPDVTACISKESMQQLRAQMYATHPQYSTDVSMMRKAMIKELLLGQDKSDEVVEEAFAVFYRARSEVVLYEGTIELLEALRTKYKLAAITNGNADLNLIGIADYFGDIQSASLTSAPKPAPDMFNSCCENLGVDNAALLHVGDNPITDVVGGYLAGAKTVWFNQSGEPWPEAASASDLVGPEFHGPDFEVSSIQELHNLLNQPS